MRIAIVLLLSSLAFAGDDASKTFHHCTLIGGSANSPHLFDRSEIYKCDEGNIELSGQENETIEYGYVFSTELGRPSCEPPHKPLTSDLKWNKWCSTPKPWDANQKERCGDTRGMCFDGKPATWDPKWQGFSCATPNHTWKEATGQQPRN
jgi:hypothetical protein